MTDDTRDRTVPTVGLVLFEGAEELDWAGPWEVFATAGSNGALRIVTIAETSPVTSAHGLRVLPDHGLDDAPALDVVMVPGGLATRQQVDNERLVHWLRQRCEQATWITSVCTGALLLEAAGQLDGRKATTHWAALDELGQRADVSVVRGERYVIDGNVATAAGVSAGIDLSLWLVGEMLGEETGQTTALFMEYDPDPPFEIASLRGF
jgi:transcriptional regulator GlxA family with amidase domain